MVGMMIRRSVPLDFAYELYGYDYGKYTMSFADMGFIACTPFRHPLLGLLAAPFIVVGAQVARMSLQTYLIFLQAVFAIFGTLSAWLVWRISGWIAFCIFLTIPFVWLAAAVPESYAISMCILLAVVWWARNQETCGKGALANACVWTALFIAAGGVTITNGFKVAVVYVIANRLSRRQWKWFMIGTAGMLILGVAYFALRMWMWNAAHPDMCKSPWQSLLLNLRWMISDMSPAERVKATIGNFFVFPFAMGNSCATIWAALIGSAALAGAWVARKDRIIWAMGGMFAVDVAIHVVCGWALEEAWIFAPHWVWMVPVLIGVLARRKEAVT